MKKIVAMLEKKLAPISYVIQGNKYISAIQYGIMCSMAPLMVGAFACILSDLPIDAYQNFMISIFGKEIWSSWNWGVIFNATINLVGLMALIGISYELARQEKMAIVPTMMIALMNYFILIHLSDGGVTGNDLNAQALFIAIIVAISSVELTKLLIDKKVTIKMPNSIPAFVEQQFTVIIPAVINAVLFLLIRFLIQYATPFVSANNLIYSLLALPLAKIGTSLPGTLIYTFLSSVLWLFGIHGINVVNSVMEPILLMARQENVLIFSQNALAARPFIVTKDFTNMIIFITGTGITLPLVLEMVFLCKSEKIKTIGKLGLLPGIFNVNEPIIFGLPIVMNPIIAIPFILSPMIAVFISYLSMSSGLVPYPTGAPVPWTMPAPIGGIMLCNDIRGGILQIIIILISGLIYYPFVKALDKKYLNEESQTSELEEN